MQPTVLLNISFNFEFYPLLIVALVAWLIPMLLSLLKLQKLPTVIAEILAGYLIGKFIIAQIPDPHIQSLDFLALSGFMFLMFLSGVEIDVNQILISFPKKKLNMGRFLSNPLLVGFAFFVLSLFLSYGSAHLLDMIIPINNKWYFALIMVTTSVGIILPVLKNRNELNSRYGQMIITAAAIADILSIILFSFTAFIIKHGFQPQLFLILGLFFLFYLFYRIGERLTQKTLFKRLTYQLSHAASQIQIRGTLLLIILFVVLAQFIGKEIMLLGAFLAGLLLSTFMNKSRSILLLKLDGMGYGFFIPIFFIMVGVHFDDSALSQMDSSPWLFLLGLLVVLYAIKLVPGFLWQRIFGFRKAFAGGILMASRLSLIIAASKIGLDFGIISPGINASFVLMAVITCILSPLLYNLISPMEMLKTDKVIIVGGSSSGVLLARRLKMHGKNAIIVENNKNRYLEILSKGLHAHYGSGFDRQTFYKLNLQPHNYVVLITESELKNTRISMMLKDEFQHPKIISKSSSSIIEKHLQRMQVEYLDVTRLMATTIESLILRPSTYHTLVESFENYHVEEITITNERMGGRQIKEIPFHKDGELILVRRGPKANIPHGDTYLHIHDIVTVMGTEAALQDFREKFKSSLAR
ncbi:MAG: cation:proton antiporter [Bacteroidales bacterium]|nr:cation:proton antiporter [Bacteroidales bacterium]